MILNLNAQNQAMTHHQAMMKSGGSSTTRLLLIIFGISLLFIANNVRKVSQASPRDDPSEDRFHVMPSAHVVVARGLEKLETNQVESNKKRRRRKKRERRSVLTSETGVLVNSSTNSSESFSACLLTKDDSHFLIEWLAYHYHSLPLKHLIVAVDPHSKTSPSFIFEKWRKYGLMQIDEWTDTDFIPTSTKANQTGIDVHRYRQKKFYKHCLHSLKKQGKTWVLLIDVDEYLSYNTYTRNFSTTDIMHQPGNVLSFLQREMSKNENETLLHTQDACIMMPRLRYGSVESELENVDRNVPPEFNASSFQTLRYRKYGNPNIRKQKVYGAGKTIIDISRVSAKHISPSNPHRPVNTCTRAVFMKVKQSSLVVRHYLGSLEQFFFRSDGRQEDGTIETGMKSQSVSMIIDWSLNRFVNRRSRS